MPDKIFYPFIVVFIAAMILFALSFGFKASDNPMLKLDPEETGFVVQGESLQSVVGSPGTTVQLARDSDGNITYVTAAAHVLRKDAPPSAGVFAELSSLFESGFAEKPLEVKVRARKSADNPSETFEFRYYTASVGDSQSRYFELTDEFQDYVFEFTPKAPKGDPGIDYVGVWPDIEGKSRAMDISLFSVKIIKPDAQSGFDGE